MDISNSFYDLCISASLFQANYESLLKELQTLGYRTIALNQLIDEEIINCASQDSKKKKKNSNTANHNVVPNPIKVPKDVESKYGIKVYNRLTIMFENRDIMHRVVKSLNYKNYDIIAVVPTSSEAIQFVCSNVEADILAFESINKQNYKVNRKIYNQIVAKGMHLELPYAPCIRDTASRKNIIALSHLLHSYGKSANIIVSSGAESIIDLRGPYDIINLGFLFGLSEKLSKDAITRNGTQVILNSVARRLGKTIVNVEPIPKTSLIDNDDSIDSMDDEFEKPKKKLKGDTITIID